MPMPRSHALRRVLKRTSGASTRSRQARVVKALSRVRKTRKRYGVSNHSNHGRT